MKTYVVESMEARYQGMHGIVLHFLMQAESLDEVCETAKEESLNLIEDFGLYGDEDEDNEEEFDIDDYVMYSVWEVPDCKNQTFEELEEMFIHSPEEFIKNYCIDI